VITPNLAKHEPRVLQIFTIREDKRKDSLRIERDGEAAKAFAFGFFSDLSKTQI
jgi:hypothetical protein